MYTALIVITIIVCVLLGLIVLIQNPKGGGLSTGFSASNNIMGVQRTGDILEKGTWGLVAALMVLIILINVSVPKNGAVQSSQELQKQINKPQSSPLSPAFGGQDTNKK